MVNEEYYSLCSAMENPGGVQTMLTKEKPKFANYCYLVPTLDSSKISELTPPITRSSHLVAIQCDLNPSEAYFDLMTQRHLSRTRYH